MDIINTIGRRKASVARVYMSEGKGTITVNDRPLEKYFASQEGKYDIKVNVDGGGTTGQADAIKLAIARAIVKADPEHKPALRADDQKMGSKNGTVYFYGAKWYPHLRP